MKAMGTSMLGVQSMESRLNQSIEWVQEESLFLANMMHYSVDFED